MARLEITKYSRTADGSDIVNHLGKYFADHWFNNEEGPLNNKDCMRKFGPSPFKHTIIISVEPFVE